MKKNSEILYELALKWSDEDVLLEHALSEMTVRGALTEAGDGAIDAPDVEKLRAATNQTLDAVTANIKLASDSNITSLADYFTKIKNSLSKANDLVAKLDLSDNSGMAGKLKGFFGSKVTAGRAFQAVIDLQNKSNAAASTIGRALELITRNINSDKVGDDVKLGELTKDEHGVDADQLRTGITKAFKTSQPKGFMAKLGGFLSKAKLPKIPGADAAGDFPVDTMSDEILGLTWGQFKALSSGTEKTAEEAEGAEVPADAVADIAKAEEVSGDAAGEEAKEGGDEEEAKEGGDEEVPKNAEEESNPAEEIEAVATAAASTPMTPKDAVAKALGDWEASLSASSQKALQAKKRNQQLKDAVFSGIDKGKKAVQNAVAKAVKGWRAEHEETLIKSKRFAKKNFDSLQVMIPQLAAQVLAQANENNQKKITRKEIDKFVYRRLNEKYFPSGVLYETWRKNAGLLKD